MSYIIQVSNYMMTGASVTLKIFFVTLVLSLPLGVALATLYRQNNVFKGFISFYTWLFRGTPLMLQLFFFMYGLPAIGIPVDRMMVAYTAFILNYSAYFTEIIRAGIESLPKDQFESAEILGCKKFTMYRYIILPQALRNTTPVITSEVITLVKDTSLVTVIAISDIMRNVKEVVSRDFTLSPFFLSAIFYLSISYLIIQVFKQIERKYNYLESS